MSFTMAVELFWVEGDMNCTLAHSCVVGSMLRRAFMFLVVQLSSTGCLLLLAAAQVQPSMKQVSTRAKTTYGHCDCMMSHETPD